MKWFRLYHDLIDDAKVQLLDGETFKRWINLLCIASASDQRGALPSRVEIAFRLRITLDELDATIDTLREAGLIELNDDTIAIHNWSERQPISESSTARVRKHRKNADDSRDETGGAVTETPKKRLRNAGVTVSETLQKRDETPLDKNRLDKTRQDEKRRDETQTTPSSSSGRSRSRSATARSKAIKPDKFPRNDHERLIEWWAEFSGAGMPTVLGKALNSAKRLTDAGLTLEDAPELYKFCAEFMDGVTLEKMLSQFDSWKAARASPHRRSTNRRQRNVGMDFAEIVAIGMEDER